MVAKRILVPTDGSAHSLAAVDTAIEVASLTGGSVTAVYVVDTSAVSMSRGDVIEAMTAALNREGEEAVAEAKARCDAAGIACGTEVVRGIPADKIVEMSGDYDLIVMSTMGRTGLAKLLIGSVAERVVRLAGCKVLTIRSGRSTPGAGQQR